MLRIAQTWWAHPKRSIDGWQNINQTTFVCLLQRRDAQVAKVYMPQSRICWLRKQGSNRLKSSILYTATQKSTRGSVSNSNKTSIKKVQSILLSNVAYSKDQSPNLKHEEYWKNKWDQQKCINRNCTRTFDRNGRRIIESDVTRLLKKGREPILTVGHVKGSTTILNPSPRLRCNKGSKGAFNRNNHWSIATTSLSFCPFLSYLSSPWSICRAYCNRDGQQSRNS